MTSRDTTTTLRSYARRLERFAGAGRMAHLSLLFLVRALTDGVGFFLLVPILEILASPGGGRSAITRAVVALGMPTTLQGLLMVFVLVIALRAVLLRARDVAVNRLMLEFVDHIRARLLASVARAAWPFLAQRRMSDVANSFAADVTHVAAGTYFALRLPALLVLILVQAIVAVRLAPGLALGTLVCAALLGFALRASSGASTNWGARRRRRKRRSSTRCPPALARRIVARMKVSGLGPFPSPARTRTTTL